MNTLDTHTQSERELYSSHIFLFPFKWENCFPNKEAKSKVFTDRTNLDQFEDLIRGKKTADDSVNYRWYPRKFSLSSIDNFNEFNYFYDFVREVLYDSEEELSVERAGTTDILRHFEYKLPKKEEAVLHYAIKVNSLKKNDETKLKEKTTTTYYLEVDDILLNIYKSGVGVLTFFLANRVKAQSDQESVFQINQFGRRIYPAFYDLDPRFIGSNREFKTSFEAGLKGGGMDYSLGTLVPEGSQNKEIAERITLIESPGILEGKNPQLPKLPNEDFLFSDSFYKYRRRENLQAGPFLLPGFISNLFPNPSKIVTQEPKRFAPESQGKVFISPALDDRMFVVSWFGEDQWAKSLEPKKSPLPYIGNGVRCAPDYYPYKRLAKDYAWQKPAGSHWYEYVFVDNFWGRTCRNVEMAEELLDQHTYQRWVEYGTYYGITRYSLVCLTSSLAELKKNNAAFLVHHMQSIYYKLVELVLVQRASLLKFSDEVTHLTHFGKSQGGGQSVSMLSRQVQDLYKNYILYVNKIYFREVTAQEQGTEIYDMLHQHMRLEQHVKDLDKEIEELNNYVGALEEGSTSQKLNALTIIGALFLLPSFILSIYGLSPYKEFMAALETQAVLWGGLIAGGVSLALTSLEAAGIRVFPTWVEIPLTWWKRSRFFAVVTGLILCLMVFVLPKQAKKPVPAKEKYHLEIQGSSPGLPLGNKSPSAGDTLELRLSITKDTTSNDE